MTFIEFKDSLNKFTVFSVRDIRKIDPQFERRNLKNWQDKGYIKKVIKGHYIFTDLEINESVLYEIANKIYSPSYVSLEMALSYYHLIPESVYQITSVATKKTKEFMTPIASFNFRTLRPNLFFGYKIVSYDQKSFKIADGEKAILDYLYFNPRLQSEGDFKEMRIDAGSYNEYINQDTIRNYLEQYWQKKFRLRVNGFLRFMENA
ncbi:hypothetical protein LCGC14_1611760 [marine sediment metagenome]|uniref:AbiEi antitoxin C-terminal domain-containing protein n=1 Tax=marine sediment metagenome TaxID=412755 RepID=A0A0F9I821_9ZZZZ